MSVAPGARAWDSDDDDDADVREDEYAAADDALAPEETCARIERLAVAHARALLLPPSPLSPPSRERATRDAAAVEFAIRDVRAAVYAPGAGADAGAYRLPANAATTRVRLHDARRPAAYARLWKLLATVHHHLSERRAITQRALYYLLCARHPKLFPPGRARLVAAALRDAVTLLNCTRAAMGVTSASRGQVAGRVAILTPEDGVWRDFSDASAHFVVPGDVRAVERARLRSDARFVLIVEKDAAFDKLCRERIHARVPCVLVTAKGFPDLATRAFLKKFASEFPRVPMLALVDWNPSGLLILRTYRAGSSGGALEASRYALDVKWLGVRRADLERVDARARQPLTELDKAKIKNMLAAETGASQASELRAMLESGMKAEIESLYPEADGGVFTLSEFVVSKYLRGDYF
ncbi:type II DNA topoisomerase VI subunit A 1 [Micromonas pusilla CCMP1545]|uniref:DNA topoisomerase (ATP-hydrolyzing) n=1 Tax=Micromonas pusilla (strain CCMP1545) TaxID=564608 RepID=C1MN96_MICPC|nr:type II DNA topoisomerase VI subunit A 1 [Micromonas pusilla CCMP1545]EEH59184.1 type II DNA topoisomerase VI subunit A 1 [Micromonas pusilla CCMP1545]|eukprot:XP_003057539.1 type II DNA topoisomerase VI subunit A 1 [Micromonas pusilla CCMP1545]